MDPLSIGPPAEIPEPASSREGLSGRHARSRTRAASRHAKTRTRGSEVQPERPEGAREGRARSVHRNRRQRSQGRVAGRGGENRTEGMHNEASLQPTGESNFSARLQGKTSRGLKSGAVSEAVKPGAQKANQAAPTLAAAVSLAKPEVSGAMKAAAMTADGAARSVAQGAGKVTGSAARGGAGVPVAGATTQGREARQRASVSTPAEAAPATTPEREQAADVLRQVRLQLFPEARTATVYLKPAELGRISIRIVVNGESVEAIVRAESPEALAALEQHMPELQASLEDHGFSDAQLDLALGYEGEASEGDEASVDARATEPTPEQLHRLFSDAEGVDFFA